MLKAKIIIVLLMFLPTLVLGQYTGKVYVDKNGNNTYDRGE